MSGTGRCGVLRLRGRKHEKKEEEFKERSNISLDDLFAQIQEGNVRDLNIIIKEMKGLIKYE